MGKQSKKRQERRAQRQLDSREGEGERIGVACPGLRAHVASAAIKKDNKLTFKYTEPGLVDGISVCGDCGDSMVTVGDRYACLSSLSPEELFAGGLNPEFDDDGNMIGAERMSPCPCCPPGQRQIVLDLALFSGHRDILIEAMKKFNVFVSLE
jgi:hypothetical protein